MSYETNMVSVALMEAATDIENEVLFKMLLRAAVDARFRNRVEAEKIADILDRLDYYNLWERADNIRARYEGLLAAK